MKTAILDSLGAVTLFAAATLPLSCTSLPTTTDLQPLVATAGQYSMLAQPAPDDEPSGVCGTCGTPVPPGGGYLGDGTVKLPCPECNESGQPKCTCPCGGRGYIVKADGSRWACPCEPSCPCKCEDGRCQLRR
jgi:hypothetical protein